MRNDHRHSQSIVSKAAACLVIVVLGGSLQSGGNASATSARDQDQAKNNASSARAVQTEMRNVMYHYNEKTVAHIRMLSGELIPTGENAMPVFDDKNSFTLKVSSAEIAMNTDSLGNALNSYAFASAKSPLKDVTMTISKGKLKVKGKLHDKGDIPFETDGELTPTADGKLRMQADKIRALHLPVKGLMDLIGADISDFIKTEKVPGLSADKDGLIFDLKEMLPPPHIDGAVRAVKIEGQNIVLTFGSPAKNSREPAGNYMAYHGNQLRFGKLTMSDADLTLLDMNPQDPFDFYLDHYREQLQAGYAKIGANFGLRVYMKDFSKIAGPRSSTKPSGM